MTPTAAPAVNILLVDDQEANLRALEAILRPLGQDLVRAGSGEAALRHLLRQDFAVVLLDVQMRGLDGFETAKLIRGRERSRHTPIIFLTAAETADFPAAKAYTLGAVDYLVKPLVPDILRAKVGVFVQLFQQAERARRMERAEYEQRLANEALRVSERRFRAIIENSYDALALLDPAATIRYASPSTARVLGHAPEEFVGRNGFEFMHPDDLRRTTDIFRRLVEHPGTTLTATFQYRHKDGTWLWIEATGTGLLHEPGVGAVVVNYRDITEQRRAAEALRESEQRFARFMQHLPGLAWAKDLGGRYVYANDAAERAFRTPRAALYGKTDEAVFPPETAAQFKQNDRRALASEAGVRVVETLKQEDGVVHHSVVSKFPIPGPGGRPALVGGMAIDITDRVEMEAALKDADRRKDEFLAVLAHELRNPLAPLLNGLHILRQPGATPQSQEQTRDMMERQLRHLARLVDDLLDVSRISRGKVQLRCERIDLARLARTAAEDRRPVLERAGLALVVKAPETPVWVTGDRTRLAQIVNNLLDNSAKFSDGGRKVTVRVAADAGQRRAVLSVRDEGIGIEPEVLPRLFNVFAQADRSLDRSRGGLGLGLALVKGLAELHAGGAEAFSEGPGRGAEFRVWLPLAEEPAPVAPTAGRPQVSAERRRILVVEDSKDAAESLRVLLELLGHEVRVAYTGPQGVEAAKEWRPDIVLCDIGLPGLDGYGVARALRLNPTTARARLLALTGYGQEEDRRRSREAGFDHHLVKPADPEELQQLLAPA
jgi:PAS domain S-box-containing protein